jgi:hypothetical protein
MKLGTAFAAVVMLLASGARAQDGAPGVPPDLSDSDSMEEFRICRAAVFYHLDEDDPNSMVPRSVALALRDQIEMVMSESLFGRPREGLEQNQRLVQFAETWFLGFNRTIARSRNMLLDRERREQILIECVPRVWSTARFYFEQLARWRQAAETAPEPMTEDEMRAMAHRFNERFGLAE